MRPLVTCRLTGVVFVLSWLICLRPEPSAFAEFYGRWEYHDLGQHHLTIETEPDVYRSFLPYFIAADFSGLVGGWLSNEEGPPRFFDVHTGQFREPLPDEYGEVRNVYDNIALIDGGLQRWLYNHSTGEMSSIDVPDLELIQGAQMNRSAQVAVPFLDPGDGLGYGTQPLVLWPNGEQIRPPYEAERFPGVPRPIGNMTVNDISENGWVTGAVGGEVPVFGGETSAGFVANFFTGEYTELPFSGKLVNDRGQVAGFLDDSGNTMPFWDGQTVSQTQYWSGGRTSEPPPHLAVDGNSLVMNNHGQVVLAFAIDDNGRILKAANGPLLEVPNLSDPGGPPLLIQTQRLVLGIPLFIAGDYDASGTVDQADLDMVLLGWGTDTLPAAWRHDLPEDGGIIDQADLDEVLLRWGHTDGVPATDDGGWLSGSGTHAPEPGTLWLAACCVLIVRRLRPLCRRRA
jgi:hypothetical protein